MMWLGWSGWWMALSMVLFWGGIAALLVWGLRSVGPENREPAGTPRRILGDRLARGEIDEDEFARRIDALQAAEGNG